MTEHIIRGRARIAHELGVSERTVSRRAASGLLPVSYEPAENNNVMVLDTWQPIGAAARRVLEKLSANDDGSDGARRA